MTAERFVRLYCDGPRYDDDECPSNAEFHSEAEYPGGARKEAEGAGWVSLDGDIDLCPPCARRS